MWRNLPLAGAWRRVKRSAPRRTPHSSPLLRLTALWDEWKTLESKRQAQRELNGRAGALESDRVRMLQGRKARPLAGDLDRQARELPFAQRQQIELVRLLYRGAEVLILDEPTSLLSPDETEKFLFLMKSLREGGRTVLHEAGGHDLRAGEIHLVLSRAGRPELSSCSRSGTRLGGW